MRSVIMHNLLGGPGVDDTSPDSNLWHICNYEAVSDKVYVLFLGHKPPGKKILHRGRTIVIVVGSGSLFKDVFLSPFRLYNLARRIRPELTVTYEQIFVWWTLILIRPFSKAVNLLIPIALPDKIYEITGKSLSVKLPIWLEKIFRRWSFRMATKIVTTQSLGDYKKWLLNDRIAKKKTVVMNKLPEEAPSYNFLRNMDLKRDMPHAGSTTYNLIVVSRLMKEKLIDHAILALKELAQRDKRYRMFIIGYGDERDNLEEFAKKNGVSHLIQFEGYKNTAQILEYYKKMHVFVSPYTGGALREAALVKIPIVAYNTDWLRDALIPEKEYAAAEFNNYIQMADKIEKVITNREYADMLSGNMFKKAEQLWTLSNVSKEFEVFF